LSEELSRLLDDTGSSPDARAREIANSPALLAEARSALRDLERVATAKAGPAGVMAVIGRRIALYPQPQRTEGEAEAWWSDYYDTLADVSLASLEAGMRAYVADPASEFMPKPGRLRELAFSAPCRSLTRLYRARRAIQMADEPPAIAGPPADPEAVKSLLAEYNARNVVAAKRPELPSIAGKTDEGGVTAEMRALMARRAQERTT
jgi:hypothetical protein